ncbi:hypothetical protein BC939DRAFT_456275 [Gamsiella multidivaricata]|uniref:uncharacterized protein n=1 Tax=Gamsiella multidivaricata TaxID=101098 RepID=UPI00221EB66B|nr:uncharacterized protein BC939DRAFT_456275 [Gamsiella multidivaricata]KAI7821253.1 hypothetical protein BC939DRAFT_456275 [Gamsiella multidivaricata]
MDTLITILFSLALILLARVFDAIGSSHFPHLEKYEALPSTLFPSPSSPSRSRSPSPSYALVPSGLSSSTTFMEMDMSEIHYHGSLMSFDDDLGVQAQIQDLQKIGRRFSTVPLSAASSLEKFVRAMRLTVVWEDGHWCALEGRTLYTLRAVGWRGRVCVSVLDGGDDV